MAQIAAKVSEEEKALYEQYCEEHDIKISQLIRIAIREYLESK